MMSSTSVCNNCGTPNQSQTVYCRFCGYSLQAVIPTLYHPQTGRLMANALLKQRYRIIAPIGSGGMGAVYRAEDIQLGNRKVAVKEMSQSGLSPQELKDAAAAFRQEAIILACLQHRSLPSIFDHFEENGRWYLVMSFIEGETLADYLKHTQSGKLPLDEAMQIGGQLCTMLGYLHAQQPAIIFRDLKPSNIMRASDGHIYLIDFGIARHFKPGQAKDTAYYGSMGYAPPEQYGRAQTTPCSDIYSLGVVLYQLLSGHNPSTTPFRFPPLQSYAPSVPTELATLIMNMIELEEDKRPTSMFVVNQTLQNLVPSPHATPPPARGVPTASTKFFPPSYPNNGAYQSGFLPPYPGSGAYQPVIPPPARSNRGAYLLTLLMGMLIVIIIGSGFTYFAFFRPSANNSNQEVTNIAPTSQTRPITISTAPPSTPTQPPAPKPSPAYPHLASTYQGSVHNTTVGGTATLTLTAVVQNQQVISGNVVIGPGLMGSGPFTGTMTRDGSINFTDIMSDGSGTITFTDSLQAGGLLSGNYTTSLNQQGTWQTTPS